MKKEFPKHTVRYWESRVRERPGIQGLQARIGFAGREYWWKLNTSDRNEGADKARNIWLSLQTEGLEKTLSKFKPGSPIIQRTIPTTVLQWIDAAGPILLGGRVTPATFKKYSQALKTVCGGIKGFAPQHKGKKAEWTKAITDFRLAELTNDAIKEWARVRISEVSNNPKQLASTKRTLNGIIGSARQLFNADVIKELPNVPLPNPLPFSDAPKFERGSTKYVSTVDAKILLISAKNNLSNNNTEAYKAFLLGLCAGLRRREADLLEWRMVDLSANKIVLMETEFLSLKSVESAAEVDVDPEVMEEIRRLKAQSHGRFVIEAPGRLPVHPKNDPNYYRAEKVWDELIEWLRGHGVTAQKPFHTLRKEFGSLLANEHGIFAASHGLRHADLDTTAEHYVEKKKRFTVGLGAVLIPSATGSVSAEK